jgi:hypothetical protein
LNAQGDMTAVQKFQDGVKPASDKSHGSAANDLSLHTTPVKKDQDCVQPASDKSHEGGITANDLSCVENMHSANTLSSGYRSLSGAGICNSDTSY